MKSLPPSTICALTMLLVSVRPLVLLNCSVGALPIWPLTVWMLIVAAGLLVRLMPAKSSSGALTPVPLAVTLMLETPWASVNWPSCCTVWAWARPV